MDKPSAFKIAFIGLGNLGEPLCNSLVSKGFHVTVTDLRKDNAQRLLNAGAHWADDVAGVCKVANLVITALPSVAASRKVVEGPGGVFEHLAPGGIWIEMSTTDLNDLQRLQDVAKAKGIDVLECPVTGGVHLAHSGQITVLVGGEQAIYDRVAPVLQAMADHVYSETRIK
ncbi:MAG TPA: NAD(P)-binding domain-containing protein, partial [Burkholderiaceae bacterium]|nr:NAD(P)-binding domain-containing protein [Burkholderiaceae bacterium]